MSLQIKGEPRPYFTLVVILILGIFVGFLIKLLGYFWVILIPNVFLLALTVILLVAYFDLKQTKTKTTQSKLPSLTVIIPCFNSKKTVFRTIECIKESDYSGELDIIVVDDGSTDGSRELLLQTKGITPLLLEKNGGKAKALNEALKSAKGYAVACIDSDSYPEKSALKNAVSLLMEDEKTGAVTCFIRVEKPDSFLKKIQDIEYLTGFGFSQMTTNFMDAIFVAPGPTTIFRKKILLEIGGYDEDNITEDLEIAWRLRKYGHKIEYTPEAVVYTDVPETIYSLYRQRLRWYRGKIFNIRKHYDMLFNPKYGLFGMFILPISFSAEVAGTVLSFSFLYLILNQLWWTAQYVLSNAALGAPLFDISGFLVVGVSMMAMGVVLISPWLFVVGLSHIIGKKQVSILDLPIMIIFLLFYGTVISFFYCMSVIKEINRSDYKWK